MFVMFLLRFVNIEDILLILIYLHSLTGQECYNSPIEEEQMIVCVDVRM